MANTNEGFSYLNFILGIIFSFIFGIIFYILKQYNNLLITFIFACLLFVVLVIIMFVTKGNLRLIFWLAICYIIIIISIYFFENKFSSYKIINLLNEPIHIGDMNIDWFNPPEPQKEIFVTKEFNLPTMPKIVKIKIHVKDIDPDYRNGPVLLLTNNKPLIFINSLSPFCNIKPEDEHTFGLHWVEYNIPSGVINKGKNTISLYVLPTEYGLDDINIYDIDLYYR